MGKKSRLKKERRQFKPVTSNKPVYRFFKEKAHADALCEGKVWISTLEMCRAYEDPLQGDQGEASQVYKSGYATGGGLDADFLKIAARTGIHIGEGCSDITISNCTNQTVISDAFLLCTTKEFQPENLGKTFGEYCVKISNPKVFFNEISRKINESKPLLEATMGAVHYGKREYGGLDEPPGKIGFVKPKDQYASQKEFRFLWVPEDTSNLQPFLIDCPDIADLCSQVS